MKYLPNLSEALEWCRRAGVNMNWGRKDIAPETYQSFARSKHAGSGKIHKVTKIVIHRSGFTCGNAALFRWYHRVVNGWNDIGYHYVIGNGHKGYSTAGAIEPGRPIDIQGAHCAGHNKNSIGICLIDNSDHFSVTPPSTIELHALENLLLYLLDKFGGDCDIFGHSDLAPKSCPGAAVPIKKITQRVKLQLNQRGTLFGMG